MNNRFPSREVVERIRKQYPVGCRVELLRMDDPQAPPIGTKGIVRYVDDIGSLGVAWDNGSMLQVVYGEDLCRKLEEMTMTDKQLKQAKSQLPEGEKFNIAYSAYEGGIRLISKTADGREFRYKVIFDADDNVRIERV